MKKTKLSRATKYIREQDPLKQGLKHGLGFTGDFSGVIREQDPLKQGLKLQAERVETEARLLIREQDPLKQGLKLY